MILCLGGEDPLEEEMAPLSSILACEIPWAEEPGRLQSMGLQKSDMTENSTTHRFRISNIQCEGSGYPIPKSLTLCCLVFLDGSMFLISYVVVDEGV